MPVYSSEQLDMRKSCGEANRRLLPAVTRRPPLQLLRRPLAAGPLPPWPPPHPLPTAAERQGPLTWAASSRRHGAADGGL